MKIDFKKCGGLVPAIVQDATTKNVLMMGYMNQEALLKTIETKKVHFIAVAVSVYGQKERHLAISSI